MTLTINRLGHLGDGIADGPVYVPRTLPGEIVSGEVANGRLDKPKIQTPSASRTTPPCPHYRKCGGCALMHASDDFVAEWKTAVVRTALAGQSVSAEITGPVTSLPRSRRRAVLSGRRLKSGPVVGFHAPGSEIVTAVPECQLLHPELMSGIPACEDITARFGNRKGEMRFVLTASEAGVDAEISGLAEIDGLARIGLAAIAERHDLSRLSVEGEVIVERRPPVHRFEGIAVVPPPGAFLQATRDGESTLIKVVIHEIRRARRVVDLFAGCGTFALPISRQAEVLAVESDPVMLRALDRGWRRGTGLKSVQTEARDLFRRPFEPDELRHFDAVVIDPPRAGAEAQMAALARSDVSTIVAVSCNPVTFARDARILTEAGFVSGSVHVIDQFRWSPHVELVAAFRRSDARVRN